MVPPQKRSDGKNGKFPGKEGTACSLEVNHYKFKNEKGIKVKSAPGKKS